MAALGNDPERGAGPDDLKAVSDRIETLLEASSTGGAVQRQRAEELVGLVTDLYGTGIERVLHVLDGLGILDDDAIAALAKDDLVSGLLIVHGLHPYPPTPWNANPRDSYGTPGPYEDAVQGQPIFEENDREHFKGIDIMRTVRSFDPCLPCGVHMYLGEGKTLQKLHSPTMAAEAE